MGGTWVCLVSALAQNEALITRLSYNSLPILNRMSLYVAEGPRTTFFLLFRAAASSADVIYTHSHPAHPGGKPLPLLYRSATLKKVKMASLVSSSSSFCGGCGVGCGGDGLGPKRQSPSLLTTTTVKERKKIGRRKSREEEEGGKGYDSCCSCLYPPTFERRWWLIGHGTLAYKNLA